MKYKIGIFGSSAGDVSLALRQTTALAKVLGNYRDEVIAITGAGSGLPYAAARAANHAGVEVWGFSRAIDEATQRASLPDDDLTSYKKVVYIPKGFTWANNERICMKYRNVTSTASCDAGIIISGRWGTLNEFTNLMDMQKLVGVLTGTGGIADQLPALTKIIVKEGQGTVIFDDNPARLVERLLKQLRAKTA